MEGTSKGICTWPQTPSSFKQRTMREALTSRRNLYMSVTLKYLFTPEMGNPEHSKVAEVRISTSANLNVLPSTTVANLLIADHDKPFCTVASSLMERCSSIWKAVCLFLAPQTATLALSGHCYSLGPYQGDLKLSGHQSDQVICVGARAYDRTLPADLREDSPSTVPPTPPRSRRRNFILQRGVEIKHKATSGTFETDKLQTEQQNNKTRLPSDSSSGDGYTGSTIRYVGLYSKLADSIAVGANNKDIDISVPKW
ncbi:hypothetical protein PoB_000906900 [Plakobranchus ocellatus]|uniref:Uncharacterized protein n=1 Tax=Plakobranchus ocellatus TaxID=259542 RepID=A0AAV3YJV1_9GAST|nr:hypothetical protein PoB_000906900 [Plakobranchus ocellatus]